MKFANKILNIKQKDTEKINIKQIDVKQKDIKQANIQQRNSDQNTMDKLARLYINMSKPSIQLDSLTEKEMVEFKKSLLDLLKKNPKRTFEQIKYDYINDSYNQKKYHDLKFVKKAADIVLEQDPLHAINVGQFLIWKKEYTTLKRKGLKILKKAGRILADSNKIEDLFAASYANKIIAKESWIYKNNLEQKVSEQLFSEYTNLEIYEYIKKYYADNSKKAEYKFAYNKTILKTVGWNLVETHPEEAYWCGKTLREGKLTKKAAVNLIDTKPEYAFKCHLHFTDKKIAYKIWKHFNDNGKTLTALQIAEESQYEKLIKLTETKLLNEKPFKAYHRARSKDPSLRNRALKEISKEYDVPEAILQRVCL
ncbi:hypothetical protein HOK51_02670 [Candidatus Woesearchaeota archaeon]|jgi:hypothetical protein|nr:hypothetical protein [Candidatus Woesearchaeota archaeon]MBT6518721.1 hypothetical protein [Candidatus Woesearchaeota archaeon]MBT7367892.1 hypothetical protein [Candidatus Woesearchaeota archaeon]